MADEIKLPEPDGVTTQMQIEAMRNEFQRHFMCRNPGFAAMFPKETDVPVYTAATVRRLIVEAEERGAQRERERWERLCEDYATALDEGSPLDGSRSAAVREVARRARSTT